jgi:indolepyruvate ferredoxin oxidoreductase
MSQQTDPRFLRESGAELFNGNELLVKGALETPGGVHLLTGYPGSPVAQFFDIIEANAPLFREWGVHAAIANNEAVSVAMVNGSQMAGLRAMSVFKSVGGHVAADALALGNLAGADPAGGAVIVYGDDPWSETTQVPADSRFLSRHLRIPVLEPADPQECKDWVALGFRLSAESTLYIGYMYTTPQAEGGGSVECRPNHRPAVGTVNRVALETAGFDLERKVLLPPRTGRMEAEMPGRFARLLSAVRRLGVNRLLYAPPPGQRVPLAFVSSGMPFCYLEHALSDLGLLGEFPILKLGVTYPLDRDEIAALADIAENIVVIEDRRAFVEEQVAEIILHRNQTQPGNARAAKVWGKRFPDGLPGMPELWGLNPTIVAERVAPLVERLTRRAGSPPREGEAPAEPEGTPTDLESRLGGSLALPRLDLSRYAPSAPAPAAEADAAKALPVRTPTFCPGCPHRDSGSVLLEIKRLFRDAVYMRERHHRGPVDLVFHGDTGCYTMLMFEPNQALMHNYSGMGLGGATGAGIDPFISNKQVVFMGDSTFFHSGQIAIGNSIKAGQDITYVILDNKTTAMTGHQPTPGVDADILGRPTFVQDIARIVSAMTPDRSVVRTVNPEDRAGYKELLERTILADGVKVIIADKECGITYHRRKAREDRKVERALGYLPVKHHINITAEVCEDCRVCTTLTGCPGLVPVQTDYGPKVQTDATTCVADGACFRAGGLACPSFEHVTVRRKRPVADRSAGIDVSNLPEPAVPLLSNGGVWRAYLAGVGGMGIGVANAILVDAGFRQGYRVMFSEKRGLAIRNGGVFSQVVYAAEGAVTSSVIPAGGADLLLGVDLLEAARSVDPSGSAGTGGGVASPGRTHAVLNTRKTPTVAVLTGKEDFSPAELTQAIRSRCRPDGWFAEEVSEACQRLLGSTLYANIMMLGVGFQLGLIPVSTSNMLAAIAATVRAEKERNLRAFALGRKMVLDPAAFDFAPRRTSFRELVEEKCANFRREFRFLGAAMAAGYRELIDSATTPMATAGADDELLRAMALRTYDCWQYGGREYADRYARLVRGVFDRDRADWGRAATAAAVEGLGRVMCIKDEPYVAYLLTRVEKLDADRARFDVDESRGDRLSYRHINKPEFNLFGTRVRLPFALHTRNWMLRIVRRMRFLRSAGWGPFWHPEEEAFRDWYIGLVEGFAFSDRAGYDRYVAALRVTDEVKGYREIREPKMAAARERAASLLAGVASAPAPAPAASAPSAAPPSEPLIRLPLLSQGRA